MEQQEDEFGRATATTRDGRGNVEEPVFVFNEERNRNEEKNRQEVEKFMLKEAQPDNRTEGGGIEFVRLVAEENIYRQVSVETLMAF